MKMTRDLSYIPDDAKPVDCGTDYVAVYVYPIDHPTRKVGGIGFHGKAQKPDWHHSFKSDDQCAAYIAEYITNQRAYLDHKAARAANRKKPHTYKIGDILYSSWGYDQTNIDWYQVVDVPGPRTVVTRRIHGRAVSDEGPQVQVMPDPNNWHDHEGEPERHTVTDGSIKVSSCARAWAWDGTPRSETGAMWGH